MLQKSSDHRCVYHRRHFSLQLLSPGSELGDHFRAPESFPSLTTDRRYGTDRTRIYGDIAPLQQVRLGRPSPLFWARGVLEG
jgi:hypothetical protein